MLLKVRVKTGATKNEVIILERGSIQVNVREKPQENRANRKVEELIAHHYKVSVASVRIVKGHHSNGKILELRNL